MQEGVLPPHKPVSEATIHKFKERFPNLKLNIDTEGKGTISVIKQNK